MFMRPKRGNDYNECRPAAPLAQPGDPNPVPSRASVARLSGSRREMAAGDTTSQSLPGKPYSGMRSQRGAFVILEELSSRRRGSAVADSGRLTHLCTVNTKGVLSSFPGHKPLPISGLAYVWAVGRRVRSKPRCKMRKLTPKTIEISVDRGGGLCYTSASNGVVATRTSIYRVGRNKDVHTHHRRFHFGGERRDARAEGYPPERLTGDVQA